MASCLSNKISGITPISMFSASYSVTNNSINAITAAFLLFKINSLVIVTDLIEIGLPGGIGAAGVLTMIVITNGNVTDPSPTVTYNSSTTITKVTTTGASAGYGSTI